MVPAVSAVSSMPGEEEALQLREEEKRYLRESRATAYRPDPRDDDDPLAPPPYLRAAAFSKVGENVDTRRACLAGIRSRARDHITAGNSLHFPRIDDDQFLLAFARCKKMDPDRAFEEYLNYSRFDADHGWLRDVELSLVKRIITTGALNVLPSRDREDRSVIAVSVTPLVAIADDRSSCIERLLKAIFFFFRLHLFTDVHAQVHGAVIVGDMAGYRLRLLSLLSFNQYKLALHLCQWCLPLRANGFYLQNEPRYVRALVTALRAFMKPKVRRSFLCCGSELALLHTVITPENLPVTFGGTLKEEHDGQQVWLDRIDNFSAKSSAPSTAL